MNSIETYCFNAGKAVIIDEYGIARREILAGVTSNVQSSFSKTAGTLIWSLRGMSVNGGAHVHNEYAGFQAYQWPGYIKGPRCHPWFRDDNADVFSDLNGASNTLNKLYGVPDTSLYVPCSHRGSILEARVQGSLNSQSEKCIQTFNHSGISNTFVAVNLRIRQATGAFSNLVQFSLDNTKFINLDSADMTVTEGQFLYAHNVPVVVNSDNTKNQDVWYRLVGVMRDGHYLLSNESIRVSLGDHQLEPDFVSWLGTVSEPVFANVTGCVNVNVPTTTTFITEATTATTASDIYATTATFSSIVEASSTGPKPKPTTAPSSASSKSAPGIWHLILVLCMVSFFSS